jgi:pyruvate formate lyase activating enzyme
VVTSTITDPRPVGQPGAPVGRVFDVQRYSVHNGPGIRTTVFLKGCPLACPWCHNPESRAHEPEVRVLTSRCIACDSCRAACPHQLAGIPRDAAGTPTGGPALAPDPARCDRCGACVDACPTRARQLVGRDVTVDDLVAEVLRDRDFHQESGGGVTFSGGEPFAQPGFLLAALAALRERGVHVAVDTCGVVAPGVLREAAVLADLFLVDLKIMDPERHAAVLGAPLAPVLAGLRALDEAGVPVWLRVPLVPGFTDDEANLRAIGAFTAGLRSVRRLHLLPYHRFGAGKRDGLGMPEGLAGLTGLAGLEPPTEAAVAAAADLLRGFELDVRIGG